MEQIEHIEKAKSFQTTQAMKNAARRGLELREKWNRGGLDTRQAASEGVGSGVARARDIITKSYTLDSLEDGEFNTEDDLINMNIQISKSVEPTLRQVTYIAMRANSVDAHGDFTSEDEVRKAKESFNRALMKKQTMSNLFHMFETTEFDVIESYTSPAEMTLNGEYVQKGDWLMTLQINTDKLWDMVLKGEVVGLSIGAIAKVEKYE